MDFDSRSLGGERDPVRSARSERREYRRVRALRVWGDEGGNGEQYPGPGLQILTGAPAHAVRPGRNTRAQLNVLVQLEHLAF